MQYSDEQAHESGSESDGLHDAPLTEGSPPWSAGSSPSLLRPNQLEECFGEVSVKAL